MAALNIRDQSEFEQKVLQSEEPVLAEFWAVWCGPCLQVAPVIDEIIEEKAGQLALAKVNIDINPETQMQYGVRGIPTLMIFKSGRPVSTKVGSLPKSKLVEWIDSVIAGVGGTP
jgi:thioredoxin 1